MRKSLHGSNSPNLFAPHSNGLRSYAPGAHQHLPGVASVTLCAAPFCAAHVVSMPDHTSGLRMCAGVCSVAYKTQLGSSKGVVNLLSASTIGAGQQKPVVDSCLKNQASCQKAFAPQKPAPKAPIKQNSCLPEQTSTTPALHGRMLSATHNLTHHMPDTVGLMALHQSNP